MWGIRNENELVLIGSIMTRPQKGFQKKICHSKEKRQSEPGVPSQLEKNYRVPTSSSVRAEPYRVCTYSSRIFVNSSTM